MIFVIHGGSGTPEGMINNANFKTIEDRDKVVLVYTAGIQKNWNLPCFRLSKNRSFICIENFKVITYQFEIDL